MDPVDQIIGRLHGFAMVFSSMAWLPTVGPFLGEAAVAVTTLAANHDLVQKIFDGVQGTIQTAQTMIAWLNQTGHAIAAHWLTTHAPLPE